MLSMNDLEGQLLREQQDEAMMESEAPGPDDYDQMRKKLLFYKNTFPHDISTTPTAETRKILNLSPEELEVCVAQAETWIGSKIDTHTIQEYMYSISQNLGADKQFSENIANDGFLVATLKQLVAIQLANLNPLFRSLALIGVHFVAKSSERTPSLVDLDQKADEERDKIQQASAPKRRRIEKQ